MLVCLLGIKGAVVHEICWQHRRSRLVAHGFADPRVCSAALYDPWSSPCLLNWFYIHYFHNLLKYYRNCFDFGVVRCNWSETRVKLSTNEMQFLIWLHSATRPLGFFRAWSADTCIHYFKCFPSKPQQSTFLWHRQKQLNVTWLFNPKTAKSNQHLIQFCPHYNHWSNINVMRIVKMISDLRSCWLLNKLSLNLS